jgi:hypothetical protein
MSKTYTVAELITRVQRRGDWPNSTKVTASWIQDELEVALGTLWDLLVSKFEDYYTTTASWSTVAAQSSYALSTVVAAGDFYKLLGVDVQLGGTWYALTRYQLNERNDFQDGSAFSEYGTKRYRLEGDNLIIQPTPQAVYPMRALYVKGAPKIASTADTIDGINGWEELLVALTVRRIKASLEESTTRFDEEIATLESRITAAADARDAGAPATILDVTSRRTLDDWGY